ncbi:MAG: uracil-DNA glycosylase [Bacteroidia bacterium]|nr:uracil-DNA glycosylase [Bacteroidia bacterium]
MKDLNSYWDKLFDNIDSSWFTFFQVEKNETYFKSLIDFLEIETKHFIILPSLDSIFRVFQIPISQIKVIIIGQDPYPTKGHANGLCFSVNPGVFPLPKSLKNIYKELAIEYPDILRMNGDLSDWFKQGVFLINTLLTLREGSPLSHKNKGWEIFTDKVIQFIQKHTKNCVYLLWGKNAHLYEKTIDTKNNLIIKTSHPSPLGYTKSGFDFIPFKNSGQFCQTNQYLQNNNMTEIIW